MPSVAAKRIAKNTSMLYCRQILIILVNLYALRVVLDTLGVEDYGIYNIVAGVVTMFGFLSNSMATASLRFFSFEIGKGNNEVLKKTFSITLTIYVLLAVLIVLLAETVGLWCVCNKLVIPPERIQATLWIYQFAVLSFIVKIMTAPYMAAIIAHENMNIYAYMSIIEVILNLVIVFLLPLLPYDKLILYGFLMFIVASINTTLYKMYCKKNYEECRSRFFWDSTMFKEILSFSGWYLWGAMAGLMKDQGVSILLNLFFGPLVNAARAIASQVNTAVVSFASNFSTAIRPQIVKTYALNEIDNTLKFVFWGCKGTYFLMFFFALPLVLEMPYVLNIWLKEPPGLTVLFTRLVLIEAVIESISYPIMTLVLATGKVRRYQIVLSCVSLMNLPLSYITLKFGAPAYIVFVISIILVFFSFFIRIGLVKRLTYFPVKQFILKVVIPMFFVSAFSFVVPYFVRGFITGDFLRFCSVIFISTFMTGICVLFIGLSNNERAKVLFQIKKKVKNAYKK